MLQLYDPVATTWEPQFRGLINDYSYTIDGSASDANGDPINASIQIEAVDMFDYLNGYGLTPGLAGVTPPAGAEDGVYYAATAGTVDDRIIEILTDAGIDSTRYLVASGNTKVIAVKYDPGESALTASARRGGRRVSVHLQHLRRQVRQLRVQGPLFALQPRRCRRRTGI
jgi:hypothetical protein